MSPRGAAFVVALLASVGFLNAEVGASAWLCRSWQTDEGLPDNNVTGVAQASDGHLWVASMGGLLRFDGARFEEFSLTHVPQIANRVIRLLHLDRQGRLWLFKNRGLLLCAGEDKLDVFTRREGMPQTRITCIAEDGQGSVWFTSGGELCRILEGKIIRVTEVPGLPAEGGWCLASDRQGRLWCARRTQLEFFHDGSWQHCWTFEQAVSHLAAACSGGVWAIAGLEIFRCVEGREPQRQGRLVDSSQVRVLLEDHEGALWIGGVTMGLQRLKEARLESIPISHSDVNCLTEDREGNLWVGTEGGGLNLVRPRGVTMVGAEAGLPTESVRSVCQDTQGGLWAALQNGMLAQTRGDRWTVIGAGEGWPGGNVNCVATAHAGGVWIGTHDRGLQWLHDGRFQEWRREGGLGSRNIRSLLETRNGDLWIATSSPSKLKRFRNGTFYGLELPGEVRAIRALAEGADGTIWAGTSDGQLLRLDGERVVRETARQDDRQRSIRALHATADGSLWIGYAGGGVGRLFQGHYARVTAENGLFDDYVSQILADEQGGLWFTGNHGLFQVRLQEMVAVAEGRAERVRCVVYGRSEGLPALQPTCESSPAVCRTASGELWFSTRNGLLRVRPGDMPDNPEPPPVILQRALVDDQVVALYDRKSTLRSPSPSSWRDLREENAVLRLPPGHRKLEFEFAALSFRSLENVHFRYRLRGFDEAWVEAGVQRSARYPRLPAGDYQFEVTGCNDAGVWNEAGRQLSFVVLPFIWQTWWFRLGVLAAFTSSVVGVVRYFSFRRLRRQLEQLERQAELQRERARIARDMHDEVGAKLSRLSLLSDLASQQAETPPAVCREVTDISETAREAIRSFDEIVWAVNPKNDSLAELMHYLCRYAEEYFEGSDVQCAFDLPEVVPSAALSTELRHHVFLAVKEALNNVLKHAGATQVRLQFRLMSGHFEVHVEDNGRGVPRSVTPARAGSGNGVGNMRERMRDVGGEFELVSGPNGGTRAVFRVPCPGVGMG